MTCQGVSLARWGGLRHDCNCYKAQAWLVLASPRVGVGSIIALADPAREAGETDLAARAEQELMASRARLVAASDEARRRVTRDLHDGAPSCRGSADCRRRSGSCSPRSDHGQRAAAKQSGEPHNREPPGSGARVNPSLPDGVQDLAGDAGPGNLTGATPCLT